MMKCPVCSETLALRERRAAPVVCGYCSLIVLRSMTAETLGELRRQRDDSPVFDADRSFALPPEWRHFRGVI
jgi:hypothetical protein